jgi:hypothetical protein
MPQGRLWERWGLSLILLLGFLLAIVGWQSFEELKSFWPGLAKHIFEAIAIATFIGLTVEQFLKKQFAKEVFFASVGYVLPEELRPEMRCCVNWTIFVRRTQCGVHSLPLEQTPFGFTFIGRKF